MEKIDGKLKITAMKGDIGFNPKEKDTFVLGMPYYHKAWEQDESIYSRSDTQHEGYVLCPEARKTDGMRNFCLYGKYVAGRNSQGTLGSYYAVNPTRNLPSYNNNITEAKNAEMNTALEAATITHISRLRFCLNMQTKTGTTSLVGALHIVPSILYLFRNLMQSVLFLKNQRQTSF